MAHLEEICAHLEFSANMNLFYSLRVVLRAEHVLCSTNGNPFMQDLNLRPPTYSLLFIDKNVIGM